jgi:hypothetical protein
VKGTSHAPDRRPRVRLWALRAAMLVAAMAGAGALYLRCGPRPESLPLLTSIDGPPPSRAAGVVVFLHGRGGSIAGTETMVTKLRNEGLLSTGGRSGRVRGGQTDRVIEGGSREAIVLVEGPFPSWFGRSWGHTVNGRP